MKPHDWLLTCLITIIPQIGCSSRVHTPEGSVDDRRASGSDVSTGNKSLRVPADVGNNVPQPPSGASDLEKLASHTAELGGSAEAEIELPTLTPDELNVLVEGENGQKRVLLVEFWAMWCVQSQSAHRQTAAWADQLNDDRLTVISISLDDLESRQEWREFVSPDSHRIKNLACDVGEDVGSFSESLRDLGVPDALPFYRLYDQAGKRHNLDDLGNSHEAGDVRTIQADAEALVKDAAPPGGRIE